MLISLAHRFIFVANLKTASTSIEDALLPYSDINIRRTEWGKHLGLAEIQRRFAWVFNLITFDEFVVFGVMRNPLDFVLSLYNSHLDKKFAPYRSAYTGNMPFDRFLKEWMPRHFDQSVPQYTRFLSSEGRLGMSYVIDYSGLGGQFIEITERLKLPRLTLKNENVSPPGLQISDLTNHDVSAIKQKYHDDFEVLARLSGRWILPTEREQELFLEKDPA